MQVLLDNGADPVATGTAHLYFWIGYPSHGYPTQKVISNMTLPQGGFGAGDEICPLAAAAASGYNDTGKTIKALLSAGADVHQRTSLGQTALHLLCSTACSEGCSRYDFSLDAGEEDGYWPYQTDSLKTLLEHGADVNACDNFGKSPLHYASALGNRGLVKLLLRNGADVYQKDRDGFTVLDYAASGDYKLTMAVIDKYDFPKKDIIQAYECAALDALIITF